MSILDRYLGAVILQYTLITMLVLLGLFTFVNFLDQLGELGAGYGLGDALIFIALTIPRTIYELFPMAALLGATVGLSMLANDSELIVIRAGGVSVRQIIVSALKTAALFVIASMLIGELLAPPSEARAQRGRAEALQQNIKQASNSGDSGLWLRDSDGDNLVFVNAAQVLPDLSMVGIRLFEFDADKNLRALTAAAHGSFYNVFGEEFGDGKWRLREVKQTHIADDGDDDGAVSVAHHGAIDWQSNITPKLLSVFLVKPDQLSLVQLNRHIRHLRANRQQTERYELAMWNKIMLPLSTAVMVALAIPFVFVNLRSGAMGRSLFTGIMLGLGFYAANKGFGYVVLVYGMPPVIGATVPMAAFLLLAAAMVRRVER